MASSVYYTASRLFPAKATYIDAAVLSDDDTLGTTETPDEDVEKASVDKVFVQQELRPTMTRLM